MSQPSLTIHLFGPMRVLLDAEPMPRVRTRSVEWLLALLVLRHGRVVDRSWLAGTLWPESEESRALQNLRDALMYLRKALGREGGRIQSPTRDTLTLSLGDAEADVVAFDWAVQAGDEAALQRAVALYTGPLLEGCYEAWVGLERESREQACLSALEQLAQWQQERGNHAEAIGYLQRAERLDPLRETTVRSLMTALSASGDAAAAMEAYRRLRLRLHEELSTTPGEAITHLFQQIRMQSRPGAAQKPEARGTSFPSALEPPPCVPVSPIVRPPHPLTHMIGREQEVEEIRKHLRHSRLVTLVGAGGVGKTRLALEVAALAAEEFEERVAWVELASLVESDLLLPTLALSLGVHQEGASDADTLLSQIVSQLPGSPFLLALDNCEHLLDAAAAIVQPLLTRCLGLRILATSRQRLGLTGETAWRVPSLPSPDPEELASSAQHVAETMLSYPAIQLFVERAAMARPGFRLTDMKDGLAVAWICHRLDGIPLAIELAAARVSALSVGQIASRLGDRFDLLTGGSRGALSRHQTLRALIDWSYDLLTEAEREMMGRLSVFAGGWTLEAAEAVCSVDHHRSENEIRPATEIPPSAVLNLLASLVDKSLVLSEEGDVDFRYRMLETVRVYAVEKLRQSEAENLTRNRHLAYYRDQARVSTLTLAGPDPEPVIRLLEIEMDNLRAALAWAQTKPPPGQDYLALTTALWSFWEMRGHLTEGRTHLRAALRLNRTSGSPLRAQALLGATRLAILQSDVDAALDFGQECLQRFRVQADMRGMAEALLYLGEVHWKRPDLKHRVVPLLMEALEHSRQADWRTGTIVTTMRLGMFYVEQHERKQGRSLLEKALALAQALGDPRMVAMINQDLGNLEIREGNSAQAQALLEESLEIRRRLGDRLGIAGTLGELGHMEQHGDKPRAIAYHQEQLAIYRELGNTEEMAYALHQIGVLHYQQGDYEPARQAYEEALGLIKSLPREDGFEYVRMNLGSALFHLGEPARAQELFREALALYQKASNDEGIVWALDRIGIVEARYGVAQKAARLLGAACVLRESIGISLSSQDQADLEEAVATARAALGKTDFDTLWKEGRSWSQKQAIALALEKPSD